MKVHYFKSACRCIMGCGTAPLGLRHNRSTPQTADHRPHVPAHLSQAKEGSCSRSRLLGAPTMTARNLQGCLFCITPGLLTKRCVKSLKQGGHSLACISCSCGGLQGGAQTRRRSSPWLRSCSNNA